MDLTDEQWGRFWSLLLQFPLKEKTAAADPPARSSRCAKRHPLDTAHRSALEGSSRTEDPPPTRPATSSLPEVDRGRGFRQRARSSSPRSRGARGEIDLSECYIETPQRRHVRRSRKRGACVGKTKRGKGTKIMAFSDGASVPLCVHTQGVLRRTRSPLLKRLWQTAFSESTASQSA